VDLGKQPRNSDKIMVHIDYCRSRMSASISLDYMKSKVCWKPEIKVEILKRNRWFGIITVCCYLQSVDSYVDISK